MIESIQIKNFRGIRQGQIEQFKKFNLLVGPNNSGKTAVLEALYLACTASRKANLLDAIEAGIGYVVKTANRDFLGDDPMMRVLARHSYVKPQVKPEQNGLFVSVPNPEVPLRNFKLFFLDRPQSQEVDVSLFGLEVIDNVKGIGQQDGGSGNPWQLASLILGEEVKQGGGRWVYCWSVDLSYSHTGSSAFVVAGKLPSAQQTFFYDVYTTIKHLPMDFFRRMIATIPGWTHKIAQHFKEIFQLAAPFNVNFLPPDQEQQWAQGWIAPSDQRALTIDSYGDGARSAFKILTPLLALRELVSEDAPGLFLWEEPELFQNPQTLIRLLTEVAELLKGKPIQVFIATHSLEVVAIFVQLVQDGLIAEDELSAIRLNLYEGKLASSAFNHREIQTWTEMDLDLRVPSGKVDSPLKYQFRETANAAEHTDDD